MIDVLAGGGILEPKFRDHSLTGRYKGTRECHIEPDWLLIYEIRDDVRVLMLTGQEHTRNCLKNRLYSENSPSVLIVALAEVPSTECEEQ